MKNMKKLTALVLALVLAFAMSATASAATSDPNFTAAPGTAWSTEAVAGGEVKVAAGPANSGYAFSGFSSETEAEAAAVSFNCGEDLIVDADNDGQGDYTVEGVFVSSTNTWAAEVTMNLKSNVTGAISINVARDDAVNAPSVDLTVYVEAPDGATVLDATGVSLVVKDVRVGTANTGIEVSDTNLTVMPVGEIEDNVFNGQAGCAQTYPTAAGALAIFDDDGTYSITASGGYVSGITFIDPDSGDETALNAEYVNYYGWNYCVVRNGEVVDSSSVVSGSVFALQNSDTVYWVYGTYAEAQAFFGAL